MKDRMLPMDAIEPSRDGMGIPDFFVLKRDWALRFCINYRILNSLMIQDSYAMPLSDKCIDLLRNSTTISTFDANQGY